MRAAEVGHRPDMRNLLLTVSKLGFRTACLVYIAHFFCLAIRKARWKTLRLRVKEIAEPLTLRPGTSDFFVLRQVFINKEYECFSQPHTAALSEFYQQALAKSQIPVIIDCGANIGLASIWYANLFPKAQIIAIEPEPGNFAILADNAAKYSNITPVRAAISDHITRVSLTNSGKDPWAWRANENSGTGELDTVTVDSVLARVTSPRLMIVKIDIEGGELELFRSHVDWCNGVPLIVFETHDWLFPWRGTFHAIATALTAERRDYIQNGENTFSFSHTALRKFEENNATAAAGNKEPMQGRARDMALPG